MRKPAVGALLALLVLVGSSGCSTGEGEGDITVPEAPTDAASPEASSETSDHGTETFTTEDFEAEMELDDFYFKPTNIKSPGAGTAKIELKNEGAATHTFTAPDLDVDEELAPGASKSIEVEIGAESRYEFYCRYHRDSGMRGSFQPH